MARVLIVDDEKCIRFTTGEFLKAAGHQVVLAATANEARSALSEHTFDVVLSDIVLPTDSGVALLREIRRTAPSVRVVLMTGEPDVETVTEALRCGAYDYLSKPFHKEALLRTVANAATVKALSDDLSKSQEENRRYRRELEALVAERTRMLEQTEEQLRQSQKMEAVGRLAAGVAHDFNNLLTVMQACAGFLRRRFCPNGEPCEDLSELDAAVRRAAALTQQLLLFSRQETREPVALDANDMVSSLRRMLARLLGEDVVVELDLAPDLPPMAADPSHLEQIVVNLAVNARDAMPQGGDLFIRTSHVSLRADQSTQFIESDGFQGGDFVVLTIRDTGMGMAPNTVSRVFDPFFTTKERGGGTGLGLSTVLGIVKQHDGRIALQSKPGRGTEFRIYLPVYRDAAPAGPAAKPEADDLRGTGTVLLVEDEPHVRRVVANYLNNLGYEVRALESGSVAREVSDDELDRIDLLLTDVIMPGIDGPQLARELQTRRPELDVIFMSGYAEERLSHLSLPAQDTRRFLHKPFSARELATALYAVRQGKQ